MPLHVDLITPERQSFSDEVDFIAIPAVDGEIGILPHHAPLLAKLGTGLLRLKKGNQVHAFAVSGGFIEVRPESHVSIFAESAENAEEIDVERARLALERAKERLVKADDLTATELAEVEASLARAILRVKIGKGDWRKLPPAGLN